MSIILKSVLLQYSDYHRQDLYWFYVTTKYRNVLVVFTVRVAVAVIKMFMNKIQNNKTYTCMYLSFLITFFHTSLRRK
jgi:hypothetical protein